MTPKHHQIIVTPAHMSQPNRVGRRISPRSLAEHERQGKGESCCECKPLNKTYGETVNTMTDNKFTFYRFYHFAVCERVDMAGVHAQQLRYF